MLCYSIGHCVVIVLAGTSSDIIQKLNDSPKYLKLGKIFRYIFAILAFILALYLFYLAF